MDDSVKWRLGTAVVLVYLVGALMTFFVSSDSSQRPESMRLLVSSVARFVPMIDRVVAYRNPSPDKMRAMLVAYWALIPILLLLCWGIPERFAGPPKALESKEPLFVLVRFGLTTGILAVGAFFIWYWPNLLFEKDAPISRPVMSDDTRAHLFRSTLAVVLNAPLWMGMFIWSIEGMRSEATFLYRYFKQKV